MTAGELDALDAARAAATPGPWARDPIGTLYGIEGFPAATEADAALIVAAVNALPALVADARKYRALREAVEGLADEWKADAVDGQVWLPRQLVLTRLRTALAAARTSEGERE